MQIGDMHWAVVARDELEEEGRPTTADLVAIKLGWFVGVLDPGDSPVPISTAPDTERATTALLAAAEQGYVGSPR